MAEILFFRTPEKLRKWFEKNHDRIVEQWIGFYKRDSGKPSITWPESVDEALCFGWIDAVRYSVDAESYTIRFTPRKAKSIWSLVNVRRVEALLKAKKMADPGIKAFEAREKHRTGIYAFEQKRPGLSAKYKKLLRANRRAWEFFAKQAPWYQRTAGYWVSSAKQEETRARRLAKLMEVSAAGRRLDQLTPKAKRKHEK